MCSEPTEAMVRAGAAFIDDAMFASQGICPPLATDVAVQVYSTMLRLASCREFVSQEAPVAIRPLESGEYEVALLCPTSLRLPPKLLEGYGSDWQTLVRRVAQMIVDLV